VDGQAPEWTFQVVALPSGNRATATVAVIEGEVVFRTSPLWTLPLLHSDEYLAKVGAAVSLAWRFEIQDYK
jgi:hypothetical protein